MNMEAGISQSETSYSRYSEKCKSTQVIKAEDSLAIDASVI